MGKVLKSIFLICSDTDCEEILELIKESFKEKILEMHNYKLLRSDMCLDTSLDEGIHYVYFEHYAK